jgi:outer membrane protein TolC
MILVALLFTASAFAGFHSTDLVNCSIRQEMRIDQEGYLQAKVLHADARAQFLPTLTAGITPSADRVREENSNASVTSLNVEQKLLDLQNWTLKDVADVGVKISLFTILQKAYENSNSALDTLVSINLLENQKRLLEIQYQSFKLSMQIISTGSKLGISDSNDLLQLQATVLSNESELKRLEFEIQLQKANFERFFGYRSVSIGEITLAPEQKEVVVEKIPTVSVLTALVEQSELQRKALNRGLLPTLSLRGSYSTVAADHPSLRGRYPQSGASVALVVDVSNIWKESEQRSLQEPIISNRSNRLAYTSKILANEFAQIENEILVLKQRLPLLEKRVEVTQESKKVSQAKLRLGRMSFLELQQAEVAAFDASNDLYSLELRLKQLLIKKELAMGFDTSQPIKVACQL